MYKNIPATRFITVAGKTIDKNKTTKGAGKPTINCADNKNTVPLTKESLWYVDNYIVLIDYYDRTISRIAARCIRSGNIALEEYKFYPYVLDVLEEICETGNYILEHKELYPYIEKKIAGGVEALRNNLAIYQEELTNNQSPEMLRSDPNEVQKMNDVMSNFDKSVDPTSGAGMNIDELMNKLMAENNINPDSDDNNSNDNPQQ